MRLLCLLLIGLVLIACASSASQSVVNGDRIILFSQTASKQTTYMINVDGTGKSTEKSPWGLKDKPIWSPDGQWISSSTMYSEANPKNSAVYIIRSEGGYRWRVADHQCGSDTPTWSPDGIHIAYYADDCNKDGIYIVDVGCIVHQEKCGLTSVYLTQGEQPDWSPDGRRIVYRREYMGKNNIYVINTGGTGEPVNLTPDMGTCWFPRWSPDGTKIAFSCSENIGIYVMNADGSGLVSLHKSWGRDGPQWSPEGDKIAFVSSHHKGLSGLASFYAGAVFVMNADGTNVTRASLVDDEVVLWFTWLPKVFKKNSSTTGK